MHTDKLIVVRAPVTDQRVPFRRILQERGELALIEDGPEFNHLACFTLRPGAGFYRGGHIHRSKVEQFYVLRGSGVLIWTDADTGARGRTEVGTGDKVTILPGLGHRFEAREELVVVEYYRGVHDPADDAVFDDFS
ncbi:MAG: cupin domain-containing protein [Acidobacteriota bacterium]